LQASLIIEMFWWQPALATDVHDAVMDKREKHKATIAIAS
jgi:hypothetical protein